jgi:cyclohexanecarboxylate-CoA ligase
MPERTTLWEQLERRVAVAPDALFLVDDKGRRLSFSQFRQAAQETAAGLVSLGIRPQTVVSWVLPTTIDTCVLMAALSRLSVVQIPIVPIYREREIRHIVHESGVDAMLVGSPQGGTDYAAMIRSIGVRGSTHLHVLDSPLPMGDPEGLAAPPLAPPANGPEAIRWYFYTSGSTGKPKGVKHSDSGLTAAAKGMVDHLEMAPSDRSGIAFPIAHVGGPINMLASFMSGAALILIEHFDPPRAVETLRREGVTMAGSGTAFHLGYLDVQGQQATAIFPRLRCCPGGGAPKPPGLHREVKQQLGGAGILSGWGLTEAPILTMGRPGDPDVKLSVTEGRPLAGVELRAVSPEGAAVAAGEVGELRVRAPQMMHGYVDPSLDAAAFDDRGFMSTGDLGTVDDEGFVTITGRLKDIVIRNGENISAAEVEELIRLHPGVVDAVVVALPDVRTGERLCAVIEPRVGQDPLGVASLGAHLETIGLRRQAWPEQVENVPSLPRTIAGKVDKLELKEKFSLAPAPISPQKSS